MLRRSSRLSVRVLTRGEATRRGLLTSGMRITASPSATAGVGATLSVAGRVVAAAPLVVMRSGAKRTLLLRMRFAARAGLRRARGRQPARLVVTALGVTGKPITVARSIVLRG